MLPPMLGFTCLAILLSVWSRNPAVGIAAPVVIGMVMQLVGALGGVEAFRPFLLTTPFEAWHGLLADPRFTGPLTEGCSPAPSGARSPSGGLRPAPPTRHHRRLTMRRTILVIIAALAVVVALGARRRRRHRRTAAPSPGPVSSGP